MKRCLFLLMFFTAHAQESAITPRIPQELLHYARAQHNAYSQMHSTLDELSKQIPDISKDWQGAFEDLTHKLSVFNESKVELEQEVGDHPHGNWVIPFVGASAAWGVSAYAAQPLTRAIGNHIRTGVQRILRSNRTSETRFINLLASVIPGLAGHVAEKASAFGTALLSFYIIRRGANFFADAYNARIELAENNAERRFDSKLQRAEHDLKESFSRAFAAMNQSLTGLQTRLNDTQERLTTAEGALTQTQETAAETHKQVEYILGQLEQFEGTLGESAIALKDTAEGVQNLQETQQELKARLAQVSPLIQSIIREVQSVSKRQQELLELTSKGKKR